MRPFIFFDVGGTLLHFVPSHAAALGRAVRGLGRDVTDEETARAVALARSAAGDGPDASELGRNLSWWRAFFDAFAEAVGDAHLAGALWEQHRAGDWLVPAEDTRATLDALAAAGHRLGVISNWDDTLEAILERRGLLDALEVVVVSTAVGAAKPDPAIFRYALEAAGVDPAHAVHVGDEPLADVQGARAVGIRPVLLGRSATGIDCIARLSDLLTLPGLGGARHPSRARC
jgi:putative hydrolase of the HAD superfamily